MRLETTVRSAAPDGPGADVDVVVEGPPGTPLVEVLDELARAAGLPHGAPPAVRVDGAAVAPGAALGAPPLLRGAVLDLAPAHRAPVAASGARGPRTSTAALRAVSGPDAGARAPLPLGRSWLGRASGSLLSLADPAASPRHVELDRSPAGTRVRAAGSCGGAQLDGRLLDETWTPLAPGALLQVGAGTFQLVVAPEVGRDGRRHHLAADGRGGLVLPGTVALPEPPAPVEVVLPATPVAAPAARTAWAAVLAPALVAVPLALLWSPVALLLAGTGPLVALLTAVGDRRRRTRDHRRALAEHSAAVRRARTRAERALSAERAALEQLHPGPAALLDLAEVGGPLLWSGSALQVRLGTARTPSGVVVTPEDGDDDGGAAVERLTHEVGPFVVDLAHAPRVAVCGDLGAARSAVRTLVSQLAVLHPPEGVHLSVVTDHPQEWAWTRWLPHSAPDGTGQRVVVVDTPDGLDGACSAAAAAAVVVVVARGGEPVPGTCAVLRVRAGGAATWTGVPGVGTRASLVTGPAADPEDRPADLVADLVARPLAEELARGLAPLRSSSAGGGTGGGGTTAPPLSELLARSSGSDPLDAPAVARSWDRPRGASVAVPVGVRPDGAPWVLDLDADGPHALVAGTTGAGKSSLLVAWLLSLAVAVPPEELSVVLVDYKGGATAGRLRGLPHLVGSVTDLDEHLAHRALTSLTAEVRRRERVLAEHGAVDRAELLRTRADGARLLPRLLVVVDEVRVLADEVPDLVPGLVRLAAVGRSLGVHLVLATQRPAGAVSADARANTNLRVALRVRDAPDSLDVLDDPGAAHLPPDRPGAALVRRGGRDLEPVQVASLVRRPPRRVRVLVGDQPVAPSALDRPAADPGAAPEVDEVPLLVGSLRDAAAARGVRSTPSAAPWLPALPDLLPWRHPHDAPPPASSDDDDNDDNDDDASGGPAAGLPLGLLDEPAVPAQRLLRWAGEAPLAVCGGPGSGRTSLLRWVAAASERPVHLVGDPTELADAADLPQVASTVDPDDGEHLVRVLQHLTDAHRSGQPRREAPLLLVDGADRVLAGRSCGGARHEADAAADLLAALVAAGAPVVLACDAAALSSRALSSVRDVLLLAPADRTAAVLAGVPAAATPVHWPPGRALRLRPGPLRECQLPLLDASALTGSSHAVPPVAPLDGVPVVPALPRHLAASELPVGSAGGGALLVGRGGLQADAVGLDLGPGAGALVVGQPGSGRSSTLRLLAERAAAAGRACVLVQPRPALGSAAQHGAHGAGGPAQAPVVVTGTDAAAGQALLAALTALSEPASGPLSDSQSGSASGSAQRAPLVLVDDAELLLGTPVEALLLDLLDGAGPPCAVVAAGTSGLLPTHRGLAVALRRHRSGLLLHPVSPGDAELLGARPTVVRGGLPGRASLVRAGALVVVQLAQL